MAVNQVTSNYSSTATSSASSSSSVSSNTTLGKEAFLQLLVEQLKNQDPMNPMDNTEYIAQLTQFTSVEQLMNISDKLDAMSMNLGSASTLIGKTIEWAELDEEGEVVNKSGVVDAIYAGDDGLYAKVGDTHILLDVILGVTDTAAEGTEETGDTEEGAGSEEEASGSVDETEGTEEA
ncbi:flagellar hook assembly protein FlgD [Paenibacillus thailandensis]|uniref:Flagellar hook assembly protein FlgD n=1 Tax=Paenibacillus thailandensis TaxID=393250 RepID=A0ABW5QXK1_9BACL